MQKTTARIAVPDAEELIRRLSKHWAHGFEVQHSEARAVIDFGTSRCELLASGSDLRINLEISDPEEVELLERIVADHVGRMADDRGLEILWSRL